MDELINKKEAIEAMRQEYEEDVKLFGVAIPECFPWTTAVKVLNCMPTVCKGIDEDWIVKQIQNTSGAESSYYSRLLRKWREENGH